MSYYPEPDSHIKNKIKIELDLSHYVAKKELGHATGVNTSDLATKKDFIALKAEVSKLDINKLVKVPTSLNNSNTKVIDNEVVKNTKFNTLKTKVNKLEKKIPGAITLIHINQYNKDKQNLEKKMELLITNTGYKWFSDYICFEYKN